MSLFFRQSLQIIECFSCEEDPKLNTYSTTYVLKNVGSSLFDSFCPATHTRTESKEALPSYKYHATEHNTDHTLKIDTGQNFHFPCSTKVQTEYDGIRFFSKSVTNILSSVIESSDIQAMLKDKQDNIRLAIAKNKLSPIGYLNGTPNSTLFKGPPLYSMCGPKFLQSDRCYSTILDRRIPSPTKPPSSLNYSTAVKISTSGLKCSKRFKYCTSPIVVVRPRPKDPYPIPICRKVVERPRCPARRPCVDCPSGLHPTVRGGLKIYRAICLFVCLPTIAYLSFDILNNFHHPKRPKFAKYEYMRIRYKMFPWSGGSIKSFFHNPKLNALPDGYETEEDDEYECS